MQEPVVVDRETANNTDGGGTGSGGTGAPSEDGTEEAATDDTTTSGSSDGCGASHAPVLPWLVLMTLGAAALLRRRQTA